MDITTHLQGEKVHVEAKISTEISLSPNDIYNWVLAHDTEADLPMLKTLKWQIQRLISAIENPDQDDMRSII